MHRLHIVATALAIAASACGGTATTTTSGPASTTSTTVAEPTGTTTTTTTVPSSTTAPPTTTVAPTTTEPPQIAEDAQLLVAGDDGVFLVDPDGSATLLIEGPAAVAMDDLEGGVLFQQERGSLQRRSTVYRVAPGSGSAVATLVADPAQGLTLNGVVRDGVTFVYYTRSEGSTPEDARDTLRRLDLAAAEVQELSVIGYWESGSFPISVGGSLIMMNWYNEAVEGMRFTDLLGNQVEVVANPSPLDGFFDCNRCPSTGAISADGARFVYRDFDFATILDVDTGEELHRIPLDAVNQWSVTSFGLGRTHLIVNRELNGDRLPALLFDLTQTDPQPVELPVAGEAYLTRSPVTIEGPIPAP